MALINAHQWRGLQASSYPSEHPVRYVFLSCDGRSPGSQIYAVHLPSHDHSQWPGALTPQVWTAIRLQLRGQPRSWSLMGLPHRVPY